MNKIAFGTDGWRAILADQFTMENVRTVAQAIADYTIENNMQEQGVIVGHDTRFMGRSFALEVVSVLTANRIRVLLVNEATPTPVLAFGVKHFAASGAVMITASHNPPEYNGIKYIPEYSGPATPEITQRLEQLIDSIQQSGQVHRMSLEEASIRKLMQYIYLRPHYEAHIRRMIHFDKLKASELKIVTDPMYGAGLGYMSSLLQEAGLEVVSIHEEEDPLFGGGLPEPNDKHLDELKEEVVKQKADLGLANDGDADRFGVIDRFGQYIPPNQVLALLTRHLVKNRGLSGRVVRTVATTHLLDRIASNYELELVETPVGFKYIGAEMLESPVLIGGEESGGASILNHIPEKDGILINLLLAEMCAWEGKPIDQILADLHQEFGEFFATRIDIRLGGKERLAQRLLANPLHEVGQYRVRYVQRLDGVKLLLEDGHWVLIRPSGTEPLLRIYCEATNATALEKLEEAIRDWFTEVSV
ncbi:phosphoglucomutase/phosphomannomutase family protein [Brevibacillus sp. SYSU BS000544]|uniref:phosphoglucomutase/phosphomannomutase family protein n=1 Tax=Brevibacillus sp. SYSU BS000544 TaxID=3416443 RepID=UPI003CE499B1